jgi:hypothetical protein
MLTVNFTGRIFSLCMSDIALSTIAHQKTQSTLLQPQSLEAWTTPLHPMWLEPLGGICYGNDAAG